MALHLFVAVYRRDQPWSDNDGEDDEGVHVETVKGYQSHSTCASEATSLRDQVVRSVDSRLVHGTSRLDPAQWRTAFHLFISRPIHKIRIGSLFNMDLPLQD